MKTLHINLVSQQALPNLIPTLIPELNCEAVVLVLGDDLMQQRAERLRQLYLEQGIEVIETLICGSSTDFALLVPAAKQLAQRLQAQYPEHFKVLNATGGTKPMAMAFVQAFQPNEQQGVIYTDSNSQCLQFLSERAKSVPIGSVLDLPTYLSSCDFELHEGELSAQQRALVQQRAALTHYLAKTLIGRHDHLAKVLNAIAYSAISSVEPASQGHFANEQFFTRLPQGDWAQLCQRLHDAGIWRWDQGTCVRFNHIAAARYVCGGWLEEYALLCAINAGIEHIGVNVTGHWLIDNHFGNAASNEFDLLLLHHNQLLVVECKTGSWSQKGKAQECVNKLEALSRRLLGGQQLGKAILLSTEFLPEQGYDRMRAYHLTLLEQNKVLQFEGYLQQWLAQVEQ